MTYDNTLFWKKYEKRDDDIIIVSTVKSGTTWLQQIIIQIVFEGKYDGKINDVSIWVDSQRAMTELNILKLINNQNHRRIFKTHSSADKVYTNVNNKNRYIFITRDFRDVVWSWFNHMQNDPMKDVNKLFGDINKAHNEKELWDILMEKKYMFKSKSKKSITWTYFNTIKSWLKCKNMDNVMILHYNNLKSDLYGSVKSVIKFLGYEYTDVIVSEIVKQSTFDWMKNNTAKCAPISFINNGTDSKFINKGINKRWDGVLSDDDTEEYEELLKEFINEGDAQWVKTGNSD